MQKENFWAENRSKNRVECGTQCGTQWKRAHRLRP